MTLELKKNKLTKFDEELCNGTGWRIARFVDGKLVNVADPSDAAWYVQDLGRVESAIKRLLWDLNKGFVGTRHIVYCDNYELFDHGEINQTDDAKFAFVLARFAEEAALKN